MKECPECHGSGLKYKQNPNSKAEIIVYYCPKCGGSGEVEYTK